MTEERKGRGRVDPGPVGEMGLEFTEVGSVMQSLVNVAVERGRVSKEEVLAYLASEDFIETEWWDPLGDIVDDLERGIIEYADEHEGMVSEGFADDEPDETPTQ
jgi:hypothetical protein